MHARRFQRLLGSMLLLGLAQLCCAQQLVLTPLKPGGIYAAGERGGWTVQRPAGWSGPSTYSYTIKKNNFEIIKQGTLDVSQSVTIDVTLDEPAMLYVEIKPRDSNGPAQVVGAAV